MMATNELFRRRGFNDTSLKDVSINSGAPIGSLYHFFPGGKSALGAAVVAGSGAAYQLLFEQMADEFTDVAVAVETFFVGAAEVLENTGFIDICPIGSLARETASSNEMLRAATAGVFDSWTTALSVRLQAGGLNDVAASELALVVIASLEGCIGMSRARRDASGLRIVGRQIGELVAMRMIEFPTAPRSSSTPR